MKEVLNESIYEELKKNYLDNNLLIIINYERRLFGFNTGVPVSGNIN